MSNKDHEVKNQLKNETHQKPPRSEGAHPQSPNDLAGTPKNPREQGQGHQRQP